MPEPGNALGWGTQSRRNQNKVVRPLKVTPALTLLRHFHCDRIEDIRNRVMATETMEHRRIFRFWAPLAATWIMMSVEGPLLAALIARLEDPKFNLAAYGVAFSFALIIEGPVIMIMSASTALVRDLRSYRLLRNFTWVLIGAVTFAMLGFLARPVFHAVAVDAIGLPDQAARLTRTALFLLLPWPGMIGYRRLYQGILIGRGRTRLVAYGTVIRLIGMTLTAVFLYVFTATAGACLGAASLTMGVTLEAIASRWMCRSDLKSLSRENVDPGVLQLSYRYIWLFYYPLALTSMLSLGIHPLITFFMGHSRLSIESLAVLPVVNSLVFLFRSLGLAYQEVGIALIGKELRNYQALRDYAFLLMGAATAGLGLVAFTPLQHLWFAGVSGLSPDLSDLAGNATRILVFLPALSVLLAFQRAMVVNLRITRFVTVATLIEVTAIALGLWVGIYRYGMVGVFAAATAMMFGRLCSNTFLALCIRSKLQKPAQERN